MHTFRHNVIKRKANMIWEFSVQVSIIFPLYYRNCINFLLPRPYLFEYQISTLTLSCEKQNNLSCGERDKSYGDRGYLANYSRNMNKTLLLEVRNGCMTGWILKTNIPNDNENIFCLLFMRPSGPNSCLLSGKANKF